MEIDPDAGENVSGQLWMVHGGGFYLVEKQTKPRIMPRTLHWFKWESALTWISGKNKQNPGLCPGRSIGSSGNLP